MRECVCATHAHASAHHARAPQMPSKTLGGPWHECIIRVSDNIISISFIIMTIIVISLMSLITSIIIIVASIIANARRAAPLQGSRGLREGGQLHEARGLPVQGLQDRGLPPAGPGTAPSERLLLGERRRGLAEARMRRRALTTPGLPGRKRGPSRSAASQDLSTARFHNSKLS